MPLNNSDADVYADKYKFQLSTKNYILLKILIMKQLLFGAIAVLMFSVSCKKENDDESKSPSYNTNPPPSNGPYFVGQSPSQNQTNYFATWTTDFTDYFNFTDEFKNVSKVNVDDNTLIITENQDQSTALYFIRLAPIDDMSSFTKISSIYYPDVITVLNGSVVAYSSAFHRIGICKTSQGETEITWTEISQANEILDLKVINGEILGKAYISGSSAYVHITDDGESTNFNVPGFEATNYEYIDGKTWGLNSNSWGTISSNDWANGTWDTGNFVDFVDGNTTSISGVFQSNGYPIQVVNGEMRIYGFIVEDDGSSITNHACVNISKDAGQNWTTHLMTTIPEGSAYTIRHYSDNISILFYQEQSMNNPDIYSSSDGINFEKWEDNARISEFESMYVSQNVR